MPKLVVKKDENDIKNSVISAVAELGGFQNFVRPGDKVLIKPNFNTADSPPASTAIDFLRAVVELCNEAGAERVLIGDSSTILTMKNHAKFVRENFQKTGLYELETMERPPEIIIFDEHEWVEKEIPDGKFLKKMSVPKIMDEVNKIILLPCCKTHYIAKFTGALKLAVGFMKPFERWKFHSGNVEEKIAEMNLLYKPDLIIMDARKCFITKGPTNGEIREPGLVLASTSRVEIDLEEVKIIQGFEGNSITGVEPLEMKQIKYARELGIN